MKKGFDVCLPGYKVKSVIFHVHSEGSDVSMTSGHYVTAFCQNDIWHMANDEFVRAVKMEECTLYPCVLVLEKSERQMQTKDMLADGVACELLPWIVSITKTISPVTTKETVSAPTEVSLRGKRKSADSIRQNKLSNYFQASRSCEPEQQNSSSMNRLDGRDRADRKQDRADQSQDRADRSQDRADRSQDRADQQRGAKVTAAKGSLHRDRAAKHARERTEKAHVDPFLLEQTPLALFARRYKLPMRCGADCELRVFPDEPKEMPPISCLLQGCEDRWFTNLTEFYEHCDAVHEGYHTYRLRVLHLLSQTVWQYPGSLQRAALQNFAEFQVRGATEWDGFSQDMQTKLQMRNGLTRKERWGPRSFVACVVCAERRWSEELCSTFIAGERSEWQKEEQVCALLDPKTFVSIWPEVPAEEVVQSCPLIRMKSGQRVHLLLHKRRVTEDMCEGRQPAPLCKECRRCLVKNPPEMPARALANGKWLGRHPELMRRMPYGHRLLLPLRRVILTKVFFTANAKNPWERSHAACGLDGVTTIVEQAPALPAVKEFPPRDLAESFEAVFVGIDPEDLRKRQTFPISKTLMLKQFEFLQKYSKPHQDAVCRKSDVAEWIDGETPDVLSSNFIDAPVEELEEEIEELQGGQDSNKYRGPVDSTLGAQELLESAEDVPVSYHCPDTVPLDKTTCWQVAAAKLEEMERLASAIQVEEELSEFVQDKPRRSVLCQTAAEFRSAVGQVSAAETRKHIENAIRAEPLLADVDTDEAEAVFTQEGDAQAKLIVPTGKRYAKMWEPGFWQEWNPMDWCYGDCVYGDERLNEKPYKRTSFQEMVKHWLLREELQYDVYEGENYEADHGEPKIWEHQPDLTCF